MRVTQVTHRQTTALDTRVLGSTLDTIVALRSPLHDNPGSDYAGISLRLFCRANRPPILHQFNATLSRCTRPERTDATLQPVVIYYSTEYAHTDTHQPVAVACWKTDTLRNWFHLFLSTFDFSCSFVLFPPSSLRHAVHAIIWVGHLVVVCL